ncbi:MAG: cytochrome b/b6 domain-containing protein [Thiothrix sp.]|nr:cytochrome b/b6 domain-containing protein [Thiothrix sp.]HPQ97679.1 cytochrome b/b6 domain-containing protein [Thiolinea sp.]
MHSNTSTGQRILVWDLPVRVFHWTLALSFTGAYLTAESEYYRDIHVALGYVFAALLAFRLVWGLAGTRYARFSTFLFSPGQIMAYLKSLAGPDPEHHVGHNPAGGVAVLLLLGLGALIAASGLGLYLEIGGHDQEALFEELHEVAANAMLLLVFVHIAGVLVSSFLHHENLLGSMFSGYKQGEAGQGIRDSWWWLGVLMLLLMVGFLWFYPEWLNQGS